MVTATMPKRRSSSADARPKKKFSGAKPSTDVDVLPGRVLTDISGKQWKLGRTVGIGGFGAIFLATDDVDSVPDDDCKYVAKIEDHSSGPLFVEENCYIRIAKESYIKDYMKEKRLKKLGMPHYVASGSHNLEESQLRFLILPRFQRNLEEIFDSSKAINFKTVLTVAVQLLDVIEYIHEMGYIHCDIKASNIMINTIERGIKKKRVVGKSLRTKLKSRTRLLRSGDVQTDAYLLDLGLASKYRLSNGEHKGFCCDQRRAHAGTILFCSLDAHNGILSRRSDLESLGYNIVYWLAASLPWTNDIEDPTLVHKKKQKCLTNIHAFLGDCFSNSYPKFIYDYFKYLVELDFDADPDYDYCRNLFKRATENYDFNNQLENQIKYSMKNKNKLGAACQISYKLNRVPLSTQLTNVPAKPKRHVKNKNAAANLSWSKVLTDPELILRQGNFRNRKITESSDNSVILQNVNLEELNPTYAMVEVYNKYMERFRSGCSPRNHEDLDNIEGYTYAMMVVHARMLERQQFKEEEPKAAPRKRGRPRKSSGKVSKPNKSKSTTLITNCTRMTRHKRSLIES